MKSLFAVILMLDLLLLVSSNMTSQGWASTICNSVGDLCQYGTTLKVVGVLAFGLLLLTHGS